MKASLPTTQGTELECQGATYNNQKQLVHHGPGNCLATSPMLWQREPKSYHGNDLMPTRIMQELQRARSPPVSVIQPSRIRPNVVQI